MSNFNDKLKEEEEEVNSEEECEENSELSSESETEEIIELTEEERERIWKNFEETGVLDGWDGADIDISGEKINDEVIINNEFGFYNNVNVENWRKFSGKTLIFRNCRNLRQIHAQCLGLTGLLIEDVDDCPHLEELWISNNNLTQLDVANLEKLKIIDVNYNQLERIELEGLCNLEELYCTNNQLEWLNTDDCKKLRILHCSYNPDLEELAVNHLDNLVFLHCEGCTLEFLDLNDLKNLKELYCFDNCDYPWSEENGKFNRQGLKYLNLKNCISLKIVDAAENQIEEIFLIGLTQLEEVTLKENSLERIYVRNCPKLKLLDTSLQGIYAWNKERDKVEFVKNSGRKTNLYIDDISELEEFLYTKRSRFFLYSEMELTKEDFAHLKTFECSTGITSYFDQRLDQKRIEQENQEIGFTDSGYQSEKEENEPIITDPSQLTKSSLPGLFAKYGQDRDVTITGKHFTGTVIIDGWTKLRTLNIGNNRLSYLVIKNCPNLHTLRYAHNMMKHDAFIDWETCQKLKHIDNYNWDGKIEWDQASRDLFDQGKLTGNEKFNQEFNKKQEITILINQVKNLLERIEKEEVNSFQEFINSFQGQDFEFIFDNLNEEYQEQFTKFFVPKLKEYVKNLINNYSEAKKDEFLNEVNKILPFKAYLTDELRDQLFNLIKSINSEINPQSKEKNHWPWIVSLVLITQIYLMVKKWVAYVFKKQIS